MTASINLTTAWRDPALVHLVEKNAESIARDVLVLATDPGAPVCRLLGVPLSTSPGI